MQQHLMLINVDQWIGSYLGCAGNSYIMTPTLDQLAQDGIRFDHFYSECPVCIPARRSLMTGLSPRTHGDRVYSARMGMPHTPTLAQCFHDAGYQTVAVGKLHVYPQRSRIGFDEVILQEEGRYEFGVTDDYQTWLGENGYAGMEFMHGMGNNTYYTRPWPLPERAHPTVWGTWQMVKQIQRRDPNRPGFFYMSYQFPHPPLVPLQSYLDMYAPEEVEDPFCGDWVDDSFIMKKMCAPASSYTAKEQRMARRAYYAQCTLIDHQIRLLIGTLRECGILNNTVIAFVSDHGDMLFDHKMVAKRCLYENAARVPFILSGRPVAALRAKVDHRLGCLEDVMPTLLGLFGIPVPACVEGQSLLTDTPREMLYGEISEGEKATRMVLGERYKLIYYPYGNVKQLFDLQNDPRELHDLCHDEGSASVRDRLERFLMENLYGNDTAWIKNGNLVGVPAPGYQTEPNYELSNQRGLHWPLNSL